MAKIYFAVAGEYGCGYFADEFSAKRGAKYVGKPRYIMPHLSPEKAAYNALQMFFHYNNNSNYRLLIPLYMRENILYFRKHMKVY